MPVSPITAAEWTLMELLWERAPLTAAEAAKALRKTTKWADNTVRTLLTRLVEKGVVAAEAEGTGARQFRPAVTREECVKEESETFLKRVFRGAASPLIAHFASRADLTEDEVKRLKRVLDESLKKSESQKKKR